jgi:hypothetical protein
MPDHGQGREGVMAPSVEHRAHATQWFDDTSDRTATQRIVARQDAGHRQSGEHPGDEPEARPRVPAVKDLVRFHQLVRSRRHDPVVDASVLVMHALHLGPESRHDRGRRAE